MRVVRDCLCAFVIIFILPSSSPAAVPESRITILVLSWFGEADYRGHLRGVSERLLRYGLRNGVDYSFEFHQTRSQGDVDRIVAARRGCSCIVYSTNTSPAEFMFQSGSALPHVFATYSDPLADGWIESFRRPGGRATGVVEMPLAHEKRLDLLLRLVPKAKRIALVLEISNNGDLPREAARQFVRGRPGISVIEVWISKGDSIDVIASKLRAARVQAAYVPLGGDLAEMADEVFAAIAHERLPAAADRRADAVRGAVVALEVDRSPNLDWIASQLAMILRGASPADIPVLSPRRLILMVNLDASRALRLSVPRAVLRQADAIVSDGKY